MRASDVVAQTLGEIHRWKDDPRAVWGLPTGIPTLDYKTGGLHRSEFTIIGANTNVGKSLLAGQIAFEAARSFVNEGTGEWVYIFSNEMLERGYLFRELVGQVNVPASKFRRGEVEDLGEADMVAHNIGTLPVDITYDDEGAAVDFIKAILREGIRDGRPPGLVVHDFLQNAPGGPDSERRFAVGNLGKRLAAAARQLDVPIIGVAQLSRKAQEGEYPQISHLAESADLERAADNIWLLHRPEMHDMTKDQLLPQETTLFVAKVRGNGERGVVPLVFHPSRLRFYDAQERH